MSSIVRFAIRFFIGIIIFVGLPLLGWDLTDVQGFVAHPARLGYVTLMVLLQIFITLKFPNAGRTGGEGTKTLGRQRVAVMLMQVFSLAIVVAAPFSDRRDFAVIDGVEAVRYAGLVLFAFGFFAMNWAEASLGKQFSIQVTIQQDHQLVTDGLYRYLRHPRYLAIIIFNVGLALVFRSWLALILTAALTTVLLWRIHDEEAFMHQEFGAAWEAYSRKSWHLIPYVY